MQIISAVFKKLLKAEADEFVKEAKMFGDAKKKEWQDAIDALISNDLEDCQLWVDIHSTMSYCSDMLLGQLKLLPNLYSLSLKEFSSRLDGWSVCLLEGQSQQMVAGWILLGKYWVCDLFYLLLIYHHGHLTVKSIFIVCHSPCRWYLAMEPTWWSLEWVAQPKVAEAERWWWLHVWLQTGNLTTTPAIHGGIEECCQSNVYLQLHIIFIPYRLYAVNRVGDFVSSTLSSSTQLDEGMCVLIRAWINVPKYLIHTILH